MEFCEHAELTDADVAKLVRTIRDRVLRCLRRLGKLPAAGEEGVDGSERGDGDELLVELAAASVQGRAALGERAGERDQRVGRGTQNEPFVKGPLCADVDGFSLHAAVRVEGRYWERLDYLWRIDPGCAPVVACDPGVNQRPSALCPALRELVAETVRGRRTLSRQPLSARSRETDPRPPAAVTPPHTATYATPKTQPPHGC